jgi:outer membrane protein TolC/ABC-type uncharacterized transport system substrate-binding protein
MNKLKFLLVLVLVMVPGLLRAGPKKVRIGVVMDGPGVAYREMLGEMQKEIRALLEGEFEAIFPQKAQKVSDWSVKGISAALDQVLADPEVDLVLAVGCLASDIACRIKELPKPVIAPFILDSEIQHVPLEKGKSGRKNLNYLATPWRLERDLKAFSQVYPFGKIAFIVNGDLVEQVGKHHDKTKARAYIKKNAKDYVLVPTGREAGEALNAVPPDVDAVYLLPLLQMDPGEIDKLIKGLNARKLPTFSAAGRVHVERGVLAGLRPAEDVERMARQVAINVHRILLGEDAGDIPVAFSPGSRLVINVKTSKSIGTSPPYKVIFDAERIDDEAAHARRLSIRTTIQQALEANLDLALAHHAVLVGAEEQRIARSDLLPKFDLSTRAGVIDSDRAEASFGAQPEFAWTASLTLQEVLSEGAFANLEIQRRLQKARELKEREIGLDIVEAAIVTYLNVLQAGIAERIQKNNVLLSRSHLDLAHKRLAIGVARQFEVYRWQSEIARQRQGVINAHLQQSLAELEMNRLLRRPLEEEFVLEEIGLNSELFTGGRVGLFEILDNPRSMQVFRDFLVMEAFERSPEIQQLEETVAAVKRSIVSVKRSFWLPALVVSGQMSQRLLESGAGTGGLDLPPEVAAMAEIFPSQDDTTWSAGVALSWPLFEGGLRMARLDQSHAELARLQTQIRNVKQRIEQRVRASLQTTRASGANIELSKSAAEAAKKSLELVTDAYSRGAISILELLDAQNAALVSDLAVVNAQFAFMSDLVRAQRSAGGFFILLEKEERDAWIRKFEAHMREHNALPVKKL